MSASQSPGPTPYDQFPYRGRPCTESHPSRLHTIAALLGQKPGPAGVASCRVLEIACGDGANLLSIAESLPGATCLGIDLAARHIEAAQADAKTLGLTNVRFVQADILTLKPEDLGEFDYIIAHGLYSWVPRPVQDCLLKLSKQHLAPGGIAFISYNVLPGWRIHSILRDFMMFHNRGATSTADELKGAREALMLLSDFGKAGSGEMLRFVAEYADVFNDHLDSLGGWADSLLLYDALPAHNVPVYFSKFAGHVEEHGLQYLSEADFKMPMPGVLPAPVLEKIAGLVKSQADLEQYIDFYRMRMFRHSLLCHLAIELPGSIDVAPVDELFVSALAQPTAKVDPNDSEVAVFKSTGDKSLSTNHPLTKAAMLHLIESWPRALPFAELCEAALTRLRGRGKKAPDEAACSTVTLGMNLVRAFAHGPGPVFLNAFAPPVGTTVSPRPLARALARLQAGRGHEVTNVFHDNIGLPKLALSILALLDGSRDHAALRAELRTLAGRGEVDLSPYRGRAAAGAVAPGAAATDSLPESVLTAALTENLEILRRMGLLLKA
jgi:SAM-dependent methyltransferase